LEKCDSVDQKRQAVLQLLETRREILAQQGALIASWRSYKGRRLGPYYRLAYRVEGKQRALYLGADPRLAAEVRQALHGMQAARHQQRHGRQQHAQLRAALRCSREQWDIELRKVGLYLKGFEVRGYRRLMSAGITTVDAKGESARG